MAAFWSVIALAAFAAELGAEEVLKATEEAYISDRQFLDDSAQLDIRPLVDVGRILDLLPADVLKAGQRAQERLLAKEQEQHEQRLLVHFTATEVKVYTANHPPEDKDLLDRAPRPDELVLLCNGMEQSFAEGKSTWTFVGNVRLLAHELEVLCHEAVVSSDDKSIHFAVSGGYDFSEQQQKVICTHLQVAHLESTPLLATGRDPEKSSKWNSSLVIPAARIRQNLEDGSFVLKVE